MGDREETKNIKEILKNLNNDETKYEEEVEDVMRFGPNIEGVLVKKISAQIITK